MLQTSSFWSSCPIQNLLGANPARVSDSAKIIQPAMFMKLFGKDTPFCIAMV